MPLQSYVCASCSHTTEELFGVHEDRPKHIECEECGASAVYVFPRIARTSARWGDGHAHFDAGLGMYIENSMHKEKVLKERGIVAESDMGSHWHADRVSSIKSIKQKEIALENTYKANIEKHDGDEMQAMVETMPAKDILAGKFD